MTSTMTMLTLTCLFCLVLSMSFEEAGPALPATDALENTGPALPATDALENTGPALPATDALENTRHNDQLVRSRRATCSESESREVQIQGETFILDFDTYCDFYFVRGKHKSCKNCDDDDILIGICEENNGPSICRARTTPRPPPDTTWPLPDTTDVGHPGVTPSPHCPLNTTSLNDKIDLLQEQMETLTKLHRSNLGMGCTCSGGSTTQDVIDVISFVLLLVLAISNVFILYKVFIRAQSEYRPPGLPN